MGERGRLVDGTVDPGFTWGHAEPPVHIQEVETLSFYGRDLHCTTRGSLLRPVGLQESTSRLTAPLPPSSPVSEPRGGNPTQTQEGSASPAPGDTDIPPSRPFGSGPSLGRLYRLTAKGIRNAVRHLSCVSLCSAQLWGLFPPSRPSQAPR